ncbi:MAG: GSCFA domain-containing protein [Tateyamaria sp.]
MLITVAPVPVPATAHGQHVLSAATNSKSVLRAAAGHLAARDPLVDYFPSFEMVAGLPFGPTNYATNLRSVSPEAVARVMEVFFNAHGAPLKDAGSVPQKAPPRGDEPVDEEVCEEALLEAFAGS